MTVNVYMCDGFVASYFFVWSIRKYDEFVSVYYYDPDDLSEHVASFRFNDYVKIEITQ